MCIAITEPSRQSAAPADDAGYGATILDHDPKIGGRYTVAFAGRRAAGE